MKLSFDTIPEVRRLGERGQDILQVLLPEFTLSKEDNGELLDVCLADDLPSIADRAGKAAFFKAVQLAGNDGCARLEQRLADFRKDDRLRSYRFDCADYPLRYGNGGVLPVVRLGDGEYFCLFYRDAYPVGWNIANGASGSVEEMLSPERTMHREFGEELFACDHQKQLVYAFRPDDDEWATALQREALKAWAQRFGSHNFASYTRVPTPLKWIEGPDRARVHYGKNAKMTAGCFVNITPADNAIEVDRVALMNLQEGAAFFDGEFTRGLLYNRIVGLFRVRPMLEGLKQQHFEPDRVFYNALPATKDLGQLVDDYLRGLGTLRSPADIATYRTAPHQFDLCPITREMLGRYAGWLKDENGRSVPDDSWVPPVHEAERCEVFISHRSPDLSVAHWVTQELQAKGCRVFCCAETLPRLGESDYAKAIDRALEASTCLIVVGTKSEYFDSGWMGYEWRSFLGEIRSGRKPGGKVFTFAGNVPIHELPLGLRNVQMIPYSPSSPQDSFDSLHRYINEALKRRPVGGP